MKRVIRTFGVLIILTGVVEAQQVTLKDIVVKANKNVSDEVVSLSGASGVVIYEGKKATRVDLIKSPTIVNSNLRQAFQQTPGLLVAEENNPLFSVGYRGLPPGRAQHMQVLKDGVPIAADMVGYPEAYYIPPIDMVERMDFVRGGASLLYGPQPGGAINFITKDPYQFAPFHIETITSGGSHGLFSQYTSISGVKDQMGYMGYEHYRQTQGFRQHNNQYEVINSGAKVQYDIDEQSRLGVALDIFNEQHGIPGGLTRADFDSDPTRVTKMMDHYEMDRYAGVFSFNRELSSDFYLDTKVFGGYFQRTSWSQRGGGFGLVPSGGAASTSDIEFQEFYTSGLDTRIRQDYLLGDLPSIWTGGMTYIHGFSPRLDKRTTTVDADNGPIRKNSDRRSNYLSLFMENMVKLGKLAVTPGVRFENIWQSLKEHQNDDKTTTPLLDKSVHTTMPLLGLGVTYELTEHTDIYSNITQGYRPMTFTQAVPTGANQTINNDLEEGKSWQMDVGVKGNPVSFYNWDIGYFLMRFQDQIGTSGTTIDNVGDATYQGVEASQAIDLIGLYDLVNDSVMGKEIGKLKVVGNVMVLHARFTEGPNKGKTPQYASDYILRSGLEYDYLGKAKLSLMSTFLDDHYANDTNTSQFVVPSYKVWDLAGEVNIYKDNVKFFAGINNLFDEQYFSRVAADGIDPADGRNYYAGAKIVW